MAVGLSSGDKHLNEINDEFLSCKADRHDFPKLKVGPLPKGVKAEYVKQGVYQLTYTCPDCGTVRTRTTLKGGIVDVGVKYDYKHPKGYLAPKGAGLVKSDYVAEFGARTEPYIEAAAGRPARPRRGRK